MRAQEVAQVQLVPQRYADRLKLPRIGGGPLRQGA